MRDLRRMVFCGRKKHRSIWIGFCIDRICLNIRIELEKFPSFSRPADGIYIIFCYLFALKSLRKWPCASPFDGGVFRRVGSDAILTEDNFMIVKRNKRLLVEQVIEITA